jgi:LCP family protein required for cell wall assembly
MKKKFIISFIISFMCFGLIFSGLNKLGVFKQRSTEAMEGLEDDIDFGEGNKVKQKVKNEVLFLLMGVDAKDVKKSKGTRSDTMMLFRVNFDTGEVNMLSIPRDTRVLVKEKEDKINHAHAYGGPALTMKSLRDFLNLDIDYYVKVDYKAVMAIVEAIGGVDIDVPRNMKYKDPFADPPLNINIKKGFQTLDGKNAHDFLRWRHNNDYTSGYAEGDIGRIEAQQMFMKEFIKQTLKLKNIAKLPKFVETYYDYVETNISLDIMIKGAFSAKKIDIENMKTNTIPGVGEKIAGIDYWIYNREETSAIVQEMFGDYLLSQ